MVDAIKKYIKKGYYYEDLLPVITGKCKNKDDEELWETLQFNDEKAIGEAVVRALNELLKEEKNAKA